MTSTTKDAGLAARLPVPRQRVGILAGLLVATLLLLAIGPYVLDLYAVNILVRSFLYASVALTVDLLWGYTGILTFGQSAFFGIGAYACGLVFTHLGHSPGTVALSLFAAVAVSAMIAALVGWLSFGHQIPPIYPSVISLVLPIVVVQLLFSGGTFTGSSSGLTGFETFDLSMEAWFWVAGAMTAVTTAAAWLFVRSDAGRILVAIRENEQRCEYLGIDTTKVKILLLVACALVASLAGYAYASYSNVVAPEMASFVFGTELVIWVALGGRGTILGPVIGTILIDFISAYLAGSFPFVWRLGIGIAFVLVIVALPQGLMPVFVQIWRRLAGRRTSGSSTAPALVSSAARVIEAGEGAPAALDLKDVSKRYGSQRVLEQIDFAALRGELLSLIGPNGAGKTTLMRCISDGTERSGGRILVNGHDIDRLPPQRCVAFGIGRKFQAAAVFDSLTVAECLRISRTRIEQPSRWRRDDELALPQAALQVIEGTGLSSLLGTEVKHLSHGMKQALELAMVLALEPSILLLDEPTAGLTKPERTMIGNILVELAREHGFCILLVEHDLEFVRDISSRVIVLHLGRIVLDGTVRDVVASELVRSIYAGEDAAIEEHAP